MSYKIEKKKEPAKAKKETQRKKKGAEARERNTGRSKFVIKTGLEVILRPVLNQGQRNTFVNFVRRSVHHVSDVMYAVSLFLNWFCIQKLSDRQAIPRLTHKYLYNFAALFIIQDKQAPDNIHAAFHVLSERWGIRLIESSSFLI
ncbi:unnamed protein product [Rhizopus stolonifer]